MDIHEEFMEFMDFLQGIPVEYKLNAFNMPCTGKALCHPKIGYDDLSVSPLSTHKLPFHLWSTLMEITHTLPQIPDTKLRGDSKHNPSHVPQHTLPSQHLATPFRLHTNKPKLHESCSTKSKPYSML